MNTQPRNISKEECKQKLKEIENELKKINQQLKQTPQESWIMSSSRQNLFNQKNRLELQEVIYSDWLNN